MSCRPAACWWSARPRRAPRSPTSWPAPAGDVVLAVGAHTRLPRRYRGRDIMLWLDAMGLLDRSAEQVADLEQARREPSLQLVGRPDGRDLDLATLQPQACGSPAG